jgi:hypothetical protein
MQICFNKWKYSQQMNIMLLELFGLKLVKNKLRMRRISGKVIVTSLGGGT